MSAFFSQGCWVPSKYPWSLMPTNTSNNTNNASGFLLPVSHCVPWIIVIGTESFLIVVLNLVTVIVFTKQRQLRRKKTYILIRNLAVIDLLAGAISGPLQIERFGEQCDVWGYSTKSTWDYYLKNALLHLFSMASLSNLVAMAMERAHAIFFPFKHRLIGKPAYRTIITIIWLVAVIRESFQVILMEIHENSEELLEMINSTLYVPYYLTSLILVCISYSSIFVKTKTITRSKSRRNSVVSKERQVTSTLFIVTVVSLLTLSPVIAFISLGAFSNISFPSKIFYFHIRMIVLLFFLANSLANPIVYSLRMRGFRAGLAELFGLPANLLNATHIPPRHLS